MTDIEHIRELVAYHHWAGDQVMEALSGTSAEQLDRKWGGSFGTGRKLLQHVLGAERLWVDRWNERPTKGMPEFPASYTGREFRAEWEKIAREERTFVDGLTAKRLADTLTYTNTRGETRSYPFTLLFVHVVNHGTYHRGQLTHLLRDLGMSAPGTDYLYFPGATGA